MFLGIESFDPNKTALVDDSSSLTYGELSAFIKNTKDIFPKRSIILFLCENQIGCVLGYMSCQTHQAVPILLGASTDGELVHNIINGYQPQYMWIPEALEETYSEYTRVYSAFGYILLSLKKPLYKIHENLSLLLSTSGSTGSPKLVRYRYGNLEANAKNVALAFGWAQDERPILDLGIHYTMGLNVLNTHLSVGATVYLTTKNLLTGEFWDIIKEHKITNFTGVPFSYDALARIGFFKMELPHLTTLAQGGGKMNKNRFNQFAQYAKESGKRFIPTFGTTETSARMMYLDSDLAMEKQLSIGKAIPNGKAYLKDENNNTITTPNTEGELCYTGPNVTMGYAKTKEDLLLGDVWNGTYETGDLAYFDEDGCFYITGRRSRFLKLQGYRVGLDEVEQMIQGKFNMECACSGDDKGMDIYITDATKVNDVQKYTAEKVGLFHGLFRVYVLDSIPRNPGGKIIYKSLTPPSP